MREIRSVVKEHLLLLQRKVVQFPIPLSDSSQPSVTASPGNLILFSCL